MNIFKLHTSHPEMPDVAGYWQMIVLHCEGVRCHLGRFADWRLAVAMAFSGRTDSHGHLRRTQHQLPQAVAHT